MLLNQQIQGEFKRTYIQRNLFTWEKVPESNKSTIKKLNYCATPPSTKYSRSPRPQSPTKLAPFWPKVMALKNISLRRNYVLNLG